MKKRISSAPKSGSLYRMLGHDLTCGLMRMWVFYIPVALTALFSLAAFYRLGNAILDGACRPTLADFLLDFFKGMKVYTPGSMQDRFTIPPFFLVFHLYIAFLTARYPLSDLSGYGRQIMLRGNSRAKWWSAKFIWCMANTAVCYALVLAAAFLFSLVTGHPTGQYTPEINIQVSEIATGRLPAGMFWVVALVLPMVCSMALSALELAVSLFTKPWFGFVTAAVILALSAYFANGFFIGNYLMAMRSGYLMSGGMEIPYGFLLAGGILLASYIAGKLRFEHYDIFV